MREIKLRAWDKEKKGFSYVQISANYISMPTDIESNHIQTHCAYPQIELVRFDNVIDWQQHTGLKDKNGKEIYEGDILGCSTSHNLEVYWMGLAWGVRWKDLGNDEESIICDDGGDMGMDEKGLKYLEIIGNIHSNPEILEAK